MGVLSKQCCLFEATCHKSAQGSPYLLWIFFQTCHKDWFPMVFPMVFPTVSLSNRRWHIETSTLWGPSERPVPASPHRLQWHDIFHHHLPGSASGLWPAKIDIFWGPVIYIIIGNNYILTCNNYILIGNTISIAIINMVLSILLLQH